MAILPSRTQTGISWVKESVALFKQSPRRWLLLAMAYVGLFMMLPSLPSLQLLTLATILLWPVFIAFAARMYRNAENNSVEDVADIFKNIQPKFGTLVMLGLSCLLYASVTSYLLNADLQGLVDIAGKRGVLTESQLAQLADRMLPFLLKLVLLLAPMMMATWFSPMLIAFNGYTLVKALKSSIAGSLQHMIALTAGWLLLTAGIMLLMLVAGVLVGVLGVAIHDASRFLVSFVVFTCLLLATALMLAFQYVSYRDVFRAAPQI